MSGSLRPAKRSRTEPPVCWMDCTSLTKVPAPCLLDAKNTDSPPIIETKLATDATKEIFLDRFRKEIVNRFHFSLRSQLKQEDLKVF